MNQPQSCEDRPIFVGEVTWQDVNPNRPTIPRKPYTYNALVTEKINCTHDKFEHDDEGNWVEADNFFSGEPVFNTCCGPEYYKDGLCDTLYGVGKNDKNEFGFTSDWIEFYNISPHRRSQQLKYDNEWFTGRVNWWCTYDFNRGYVTFKDGWIHSFNGNPAWFSERYQDENPAYWAFDGYRFDSQEEMLTYAKTRPGFAEYMAEILGGKNEV